MRKLSALVAAGLFAFAVSAQADEAKYGGQVKKIGSYEGELVVKGSDVHLYVIKDHKPMNPTASMSANVRLFVNNAESTVELKPEGNKLVGKAASPAAGNVRAMTTLADGGKEVGKAQYNLNVK
ncbi:hypothetical protein V6B08_15715 [Ferrovibrio sp. MS7]|uniref:hypothetical protein n=1 Tax=Ferrovibrio TaxID=1231242 RepID=UPI003135FF01